MNICILTANYNNNNNNVYTMFISENDHKNNLNLFYYKDHICLIKDINIYLEKIKIKQKIFLCKMFKQFYI